ncbi:vesicle coat component [Extremus antarcticus]|uniref:Protein transport protein sec16 n=1 Tax=Extremus antarcticus TaxID=702011 RepID=A0AAJ0GEP5_9PEZI|nr:vesicle coat component [Extremus antarcticus]
MEIQQRHPEDLSGVSNDDPLAAHGPGSQPTGTASWNPALRRDSDAPAPEVRQPEDEDDFFDRYPGATPKKQVQLQLPQQSPLRDVESAEDDDDDDDEPESPIRRPSISVQSVIDIRNDGATPDELRRVPSNHVEVTGRLRREAESFEEEDDEALPRPVSQDGEKEILSPEDSMREQREALYEAMPEVEDVEGGKQGGGRDMWQREQGEDVADPSEHYEHQGEVTAMEEAIEPSAAAPLIDDEEPLPTPGLMSREPTMAIQAEEDDHTLEFDGAPAPRQPQPKAMPAHPQLDRSFTTNFSEIPVRSVQTQEQSIPDDWPTVGDDKTFGELLDHATQPQPTSAHANAPEQMAAGESSEIALLDEDEDLLPDDDGEVREEDLAAAWGAVVEDDELLLEETPVDGGVDPSAFFGGEDDDDGFLQDEPAPAVPQQQQRALQTNAQQPPRPQQQQYASSTSTTQLFGGHGRSAGTPSTGLDDLYSTSDSLQQQLPQYGQPQQPPQRPAMNQAQSFVDKAKGGYQSPYDLPMDVVKPRRRPQQTPHQSQQSFSGSFPAPPPRTSSMSSGVPMGQPQVPLSRPAVSGMNSMSPPQSRDANNAPPQQAAATPLPRATGTPNMSSSGFFEDLPMTKKPRARQAGAYTPQQGGIQGMPTPPPSMGPPSQPTSRQNTGGYMPHQQQQRDVLPQTPPVQQQQLQQQSPPMLGGLRRPEQMELLPQQQQSSQSQPLQMPAVPKTRYSPNLQQQQHGGGSSSLPAPAAPPVGRYSPAPVPPGQAQAKPRNPSMPNNIHPFAPPTSSPLAGMHVDKPLPSSPPRANGQQQQHMTISPPERPPPSRYAPSTDAVMEHPAMSQPPINFSPSMQRPRTQSPDAAMKRPRGVMNPGRPSSSAGMGGAAYQQQQQQPQQPQQTSVPQRPVLAHRRQFSREYTFAVPQDERSQDPLERWKGHPIFKWSASGTVLSTFPKQTPFYAAGQGLPAVKCTPGPITIQDANTFMPMDDRNAKFPGPLTARSKRQKKDVLAWLSGKIEDLERQTEGAMLDFSLHPDTRKRIEEKLVLWKLTRVFVEHDGVLEGTAAIEAEVRAILLPNLAQMAQVADLQSPMSATSIAEPVDKQVLFQLRQALLEGQRERALWLAEEKKLWGHAMLIASTLGPDSWKQIVQSFVRSQVKSVGSDARSTAALYQVFAGNSEECVDELVPPSARAGFQFIGVENRRTGGNPLEGLDQWRETVGLIVGNRTTGDGASLLALGKLLQGYGRVEAAGCCFLFARQVAKVSGADEEGVEFALLGANHSASSAETVGHDLDSILLTEVYEYATSLSAQANAVSYLPHLQAFKLLHAQELAGHGLKTNAQAYCDAITSAYTSTTRPSPYYHPVFTQAVADFGAFLAQTPHDGKAGFFSKPAMNKVSSGAASWFSKFVAGDEDAQSVASGAGGAGSEDMAGPFGRVNGESPSLSREDSSSDLYNPMMGGGMPIPGVQQVVNQTFAPSSAPSRYAPGGQASQIPSFGGAGPKMAPLQAFGGSGFPAAEPQRPSSARYAPAPSSSSLGVPRPDTIRRGSDNSLPYAPSSRRGSAQTTSSQGSYEPRPLLADESSAYSYSPAVQSPLVQAQHAPAVQEPSEVELDAANDMLAAHAAQDDEIEGGGYMPPTSSSGGYEPPEYSTYQPYEPEPDSPEDAKPRKKKMFGDDDDSDLTSQAAALTQSKSSADRAADDAFRKAAEADAARDSKGGGEGKKGWLTGWFGGKKDPNAGPGPIKAKLGEENSFHYDEDLKKWVNKKGGAEAAAPVAATPPPPRGGPPSRVASGAGSMGPPMGPPSGPPSRAGSGMGAPPGARPPTSGSGPGFPPSGPPSRVGTPASDAGMNGDGAGAMLPPSMGGAVVPPMRPASSLSTASSIDDLLAGPRKGGTVKGKKKGGRYVDVMAK